MEREIIKIDWFDLGIIVQDFEECDIIEEYDEIPNEELIKDFQLIHSETSTYDLEDQIEWINIVLFKKSTNQYFKGIIQYILCDETIYPDYLEEVFIKEKTITIYE